MPNLADLNEDVKLDIMSYLDTTDVASLLRTSWRMYSAAATRLYANVNLSHPKLDPSTVVKNAHFVRHLKVDSPLDNKRALGGLKDTLFAASRLLSLNVTNTDANFDCLRCDLKRDTVQISQLRVLRTDSLALALAIVDAGCPRLVELELCAPSVHCSAQSTQGIHELFEEGRTTQLTHLKVVRLHGKCIDDVIAALALIKAELPSARTVKVEVDLRRSYEDIVIPSDLR